MPAFIKIIVGVDEAGRGPLAGPVVAAAVTFKNKEEINGLADSKTLNEATIQKLAEEIKQKSNYAIAEASVVEVDELNIHHASLLAMKRAIAELAKQFKPNERVFVLVDGKFEPDLSDIEHPTEIICFSIIKGDSTVREISAASILAKDHRDRIMVAYHEIEAYKKYKFNEHKGYPTPKHKEALKQHGPCDIHRKSYAPVRRVSFREEEETTLVVENSSKKNRAYSVGATSEKKAAKSEKKVINKESSSEAPKSRGRSRSNSIAAKKTSISSAATPKKGMVKKVLSKRGARSTTPTARRNSITTPVPVSRASRASSNDIVEKRHSRSRSRANSIDPISSHDLSQEFIGDREHDKKVLQEKISQTILQSSERSHHNSPVRKSSRKSEYVRSIFLQEEAEKAKTGAIEVESVP